MFARVKTSRQNEYLQVVENYRDGDRVRQRVVLYVGHYDSVGDALARMPRDLRGACSQATRAEKRASDPDHGQRARRVADDLAGKLEALRRLVDGYPDLLERDHARAARQDRRRRQAMAERTAARLAKISNTSSS